MVGSPAVRGGTPESKWGVGVSRVPCAGWFGFDAYSNPVDQFGISSLSILANPKSRSLSLGQSSKHVGEACRILARPVNHLDGTLEHRV